PVKITLQETGVNTGVFKWTGRLSNIPEVPTDTKDLAKLIGRNILITYLDAADARGERAVAQAVATIVAYDPELRLSPEVAVNIGDVLTITVVDKNRVGTGTVNVMVKSTVYPIPVTYSASEKIVDGRGTGIFEAKIRAVGVAEWYPDYPEPSIPVKFGDVIEVIYVAPVNSKGETNTTLTKSVAVGIRPAIPGETRKVEILSELGEPVRPRVGALSFITVTVANVDVVAHNMTVLVVVRDPKGVAVALYFATLSLAPGASQPTGFGWTPTTLGSHTIEVYVVRSLADRTPMARPYTVSVAVA
ncbi:MAG: hypothetical protein NZ912_04960, partial [Ignisphaera sp.]|nr:hypothetical protein [Ignisphaera sp.]